MQKIVIIGRSGSGKSTLIEEFKKRGYPVINETAIQVLEERKNKVVDNNEILIRQKMIFDRQFSIEEKIEREGSNNSLLFLDRSLIDGLAYTLYHMGFIPSDFFKVNLYNRYNQVFSLARLPFQKTDLRVEKDEAEAEIIYNEVLIAYKSFKYPIVEVPVLSVKERADFILDAIDTNRVGFA